MPISLRRNPDEVPHELHDALTALSGHCPIDARTRARELRSAEGGPAGECNVQQTEGDRERMPELQEGLSLSEETTRAPHLDNRYRGLAKPGIL